MAEEDAEKGGGLPVGEYLKSVRESKGIELDEASKVTKVGKNYLMALESGEYEKLPSPAYIKGFLRLYADFLSLSGDDIVARYESSLPSPRPAQAEPVPQRPVEIMERSKIPGPGRWVVPAVLLVLVIMAAILFSEKEEKPVRQAQPPSPASPAPAPPTAAPVMPQRTSAAAPVPAQADALPPATPPSQPGGVVLRLRFNRDSWLSITIDDSISQRYDLKAGDVIEWKGAKGFVVDVGDGGAVEGDINGRPLKALGEAGKPAHVELKGQ